MAGDREPPRAGSATARPRSRSRSAAVATIAGAASPGGPAPGARRSGIAQVEPGQAHVEPECRAEQARTGGEPVVGDRATRPAIRSRGSGRPGPLAAVSLAAASRRAGVDACGRLDGADQHGGRPAVGFGDDVQARVHAVDKVHVGVARAAVHRRVARRPAEAGVRGPVGLADVRLDLDDPSGDSTVTGSSRTSRAPIRSRAASRVG